MRLVFLGSDPIALPLLEWLASGRSGEGAVEIAGVFTQPDRPAGRGQQVRPNGVKAWALERGLPVWQPEKLDEAEEARLAGLEADVALVMAYGHILRERFIGLPRLGTLNLHASILPHYRGASPIQTAVACGERETGVTLMRIVRRLDAGPVADLERVPVGPLDTAAEVEARLALACVPLLARTLPRLARGELAFAAQDEAAASYCRKLEKEDGRLDWSAPAAALAARINGLFPWPGCSAEIAGQPIRLGLADALPEAAPAPGGTVLGSDAEGLKIAAGGGVVRLRRLQRPGAKLLPAAEFLRGFPVAAGVRLPSAPMTALTGQR
ncbi:MAG TPA: methionyl-tRNA formyltransferase [Opitutaceae bacterium]|jgi:methionyl-tRNA formyltransferase|nr:methionyl-tRNA formyltransferase [Opitutaceae bacterium]